MGKKFCNFGEFPIAKNTSLSEDLKLKVISNENVVKNFSKSDFKLLICLIENDDEKAKFIETHEFASYELLDILKTFSDSKKTEILLQNKFEIHRLDICFLLSSYSEDTLLSFIKNQKEFLSEKRIEVYEIIQTLNKERQLFFITHLDDMDINHVEMKHITATLKDETKKEVDLSTLPEDCADAVDMEISKEIKTYGRIIVDFNGDMERYKDLDDLISVNPQLLSSEDLSKFRELCKICPDIKIQSNLEVGTSTTQDYINGEAWINSILESIHSEWTDIQKIAYVDNAVGRRISYSPDFGTEAFDRNSSRALWKIINDGVGVCNGISEVTSYILSKLGIESEIVSSGKHAFLKLKDVEFTTAGGDTVKGNTILDPTWNLTAERYGAKPDLFCNSYEEIRKKDFDENGADRESHKNESLTDCTLNMDNDTLINLFKSIGLTDKEGYFPIKSLFDKSDAVKARGLPLEESLKEQLLLLQNYYPNFSECINSTTDILRSVLLTQDKINYNKCIIKRVYERQDEQKKSVLYVYAELPETGKIFFYADKLKGEFIEVSQKEFEEKFECYEADRERDSGHRPWEDMKHQNNYMRKANEHEIKEAER